MAWVTVPPCGICLQHQRDSSQHLQLLSWFRRILLGISTQWLPGVFSQMSKLLLGIPGAWASFLSDRTDPSLPTAMAVVTRPKPCGKHSFNNYNSLQVAVSSYFNSRCEQTQTCGCSLLIFLGVEGLYLWKVWIPGADWISLSRAYFFFEQVGFFAENLEAVELF